MPPPSTSNEPAAELAHSSWFSGTVGDHEASLRTFVRRAFPRMRDVDDVVQESFLRLWKASAVQRVHSAKGFLFTVARRLALDRLRRDRVSPIEHVGHLSELHGVEDKSDLIDDVNRRERVRLLAEAIARLPDRCRDAFILYKVHGLPRKEAARQLGVSEKTLETHTARAMRHCEEFFRRRGVKGAFDDSR